MPSPAGSRWLWRLQILLTRNATSGDFAALAHVCLQGSGPDRPFNRAISDLQATRVNNHLHGLES